MKKKKRKQKKKKKTERGKSKEQKSYRGSTKRYAKANPRTYIFITALLKVCSPR